MCILRKTVHNAGELDIYTETRVANRNWLHGLSPLQVPGVNTRISALDSAHDVLAQSSVLQVTHENLEARRDKLRAEGQIQCPCPEDIDLHLTRTGLLDESAATISNEVSLKEDEGHVNARTSQKKAALGRLYRERQVNLDFWVCRVPRTIHLLADAEEL